MSWLLLFLLLSSIRTVQAANVIYIPTSEDAYIEEKFPSTVTWEVRNLFLGTDILYGKGKTRILLKPEFTLLQNADILFSDIEKAELVLTNYDYEGTNAQATVDSYTTTSPWSMFTVTWLNQPTITSKKDTTSINMIPGKKVINITNALLDAYKNLPIQERGILLKINAETEKAFLFWASGCDIPGGPVSCSSPDNKPTIRITYRQNVPPSSCSFKYPDTELTKSYSIGLEPKVSTDPESQPINYTGRICTDITCASILWQGAIKVGTKTTVELNDGTYYLSCLAEDGHQGAEWGEVKTFVVDTIPPTRPDIIAESPYTSERVNSVFWYPNTSETVEYQLLSSERSDFRSYNTYSEWTKDNHMTITHTKEKTFYYKVRSRDAAGNESDWSESTSTIIDVTFPAVKYFKTNKELISPKIQKDGTVVDNAYIQGGASESNIEILRLEIRNPSHNVAYTEVVEDKSYLWTHWPDTGGYEDGIYFAVFYIADSVGNVSVSDPIFITLDTSVPEIPRIKGIRNGQVFRSGSLHLAVSCSFGDLATLYLGGRIIASGKQSHTINVSKSDGSHTLKATCTDKAENKSEKSLTFSVDSTPPPKPSITFVHDYDKKSLKLQVYCREAGEVHFYRAGIAASVIRCQKGQYATYSLEKIMIYPFLATYNATITDFVGNTSEMSEKTIYLASKEQSSKPSKIICSTYFFRNRKEFQEATCSVPEALLFRYLQTISFDKSKYKTTIEVTPLTSTVVTVTVFDCKSRTIWDPRTWVGCVEEKSQEITTNVYTEPIVTSPDEIANESKTLVSISHNKKDYLELLYRLSFSFSIQIGDSTYSHQFESEKRTQQFVPLYPKDQKLGYFSWIFTSPKQVNQWHGNTAYEKLHSGLDIAVTKEKIIAPAEGKVVVAAYHKASTCFAGGYYVGIKHPNGLYTYYFHLNSLNAVSGEKISIGTTTHRGKTFATSGNSGMYNCEPLAAHLHFEVRTSMLGTSHLNPVPYFSVDWNTIKTAKVDRFPGRLSGENPHPNF